MNIFQMTSFNGHSIVITHCHMFGRMILRHSSVLFTKYKLVMDCAAPLRVNKNVSEKQRRANRNVISPGSCIAALGNLRGVTS